MPQGPRGGWVRAACTGLGAVLCAGAIGCNTADKDKPQPFGSAATGKQPGPGLPGTPTLPGQPGPGAATKTGTGMIGTPSSPVGMSGVQPTGGFQSGTGMTPTSGRTSAPSGAGSGFGSTTTGMGAGSGVLPAVGPGGSQPSTGFSNYPAPSMGPTGPQSAHTPGGASGTGHAAYSPTPPNLGDPGLAPISPPPPPGGLAAGSGPIMPPTPPVAPSTIPKHTMTTGVGAGEFGGK